MTRYAPKKVPAKQDHAPMTILCQRMPEGMVIIKGFENFLTRKELEEKYGEDIVNIYFASPVHAEKIFYASGQSRIEIEINEFRLIQISSGDVMTNKDFSKVCANIKKCGELLHKIIDFQNNPIREVKL